MSALFSRMYYSPPGRSLTPLAIHRTLETLSTYVRDTGWSDKLNLRRKPHQAKLQMRGNTELFEILWPRVCKAYDEGRFESELAHIRRLL